MILERECVKNNRLDLAIEKISMKLEQQGVVSVGEKYCYSIVGLP